MSWIQLLGETWPVTKDEADLRVHIQAADVNCPRVAWDLAVSHYIRSENFPAGKIKLERWLDIELGGLILNLRDWRRLAGLEIRGDAAWHATQEFIGPYGHSHNSPRVIVHQTNLPKSTEHEDEEIGCNDWIAHDFILRLGSRDGWSFPCELDAWLIPDEEYYRKEPETPAATARFPTEPPNFRLVTRATFVRGSVGLTRHAAADPVACAREILREEIACEPLLRTELKWMLRHTPENREIVPMPGWRSDVHFFTPPGNASFENCQPAA